MMWLQWIVALIAIWFLAGIATIAAINAWRDFVRKQPEAAFAAAAVSFVALVMIGVFAEAVLS